MKKQLISYIILVAILCAAVALLLFLQPPHQVNWTTFYTVVAIPSVCSMIIMLRFVASPVLGPFRAQFDTTTHRFRIVFIPLSIALVFFQLLLLTGCYFEISRGSNVELALLFGFFLLVAGVSNVYFLYHLTEPVNRLPSLEDDSTLYS